MDGTLLARDKYSYFGYGWDNGSFPTLVSDYSELDNYICCVCLVRNGRSETLYYDKAVGGSRPRTAIGTFADGRIWLYADPTPRTPEQLRAVALQAGVKDAVMLDGGGSTQCIFPDGKVASSRKVANFICVWNEEPSRIFRVQVGAFSNRVYADDMVANLKADGFAGSYVIYTNGVYRVQVGSFSNRTYAEMMKRSLIDAGYKAFVS